MTSQVITDHVTSCCYSPSNLSIADENYPYYYCFLLRLWDTGKNVKWDMGEIAEHRWLERSSIFSINRLNSYNKIICGCSK